MSQLQTCGSAPGEHMKWPEYPDSSERADLAEHPERGAGTVLALGLGAMVILAAVLIVLLAQSAAMALRAAAAADLAALAGADAARGISIGEPCAVAADVAQRNGASLVSCSEEAGNTVQVRTELNIRTPLGGATGLARAGPPPP
ncbi:MAG: Rv3654c family TadE-like protein [Arthrobacter sp.]